MFGGFNRRSANKKRHSQPKLLNVPAPVVRAFSSKSRHISSSRPIPSPISVPSQPEGPPVPEISHTFLLSILIPTLTARSEMLEKLMDKLKLQIRESSQGSEPDVEVVINEDDGTKPVGFKRNALIAAANGKFVVFVDDDDDISDDYVYQIRRAIIDHPNVDCIGMRAVMTTGGRSPRPVVYSKKYQIPSVKGSMFLRPPQHMTPIRRAIAIRHKFPNINLGEDGHWAKCVYPDIKSEHFVDKVLYHYRFEPSQSATQQGTRLQSQVLTDDFSIIIPTARSENLIPCVTSILAMEPALDPSRIIVVDDGARVGSEDTLKGITWVTGDKPFCFARNVNLGIKKAPGDVIILNDDTTLETKFGITSMSYAVRGSYGIGVCSAAINGFVGNPNQKRVGPTGLRQESRVVAFICVYIPRKVLDGIGRLDERFVGYGWEDNDYCRRAIQAQLRLVVYDGCVVRHGDTVKTSTFRSRPDISELSSKNRDLYIKKWGADK